MSINAEPQKKVEPYNLNSGTAGEQSHFASCIHDIPQIACNSNKMDNLTKLGANAFAKVEKIVSVASMCLSQPHYSRLYTFLQNSELLSLTYGSLVCQLIKDVEFTEGVNAQLISM